MITIRPSDDRGHFDHEWLQTWHSFSFGEYQDPDWMGFSRLRVINQDVIQPGQGFGAHGHRDMEIITYVLEGVLKHKDSMGNGSLIRPGEVQFMSAGSGVTHSEFNGSESEPVHLLQMWVLPEKEGILPRYDQKTFPTEERTGRMRLLVSPDGRDDSIIIGQDASMYGGLLEPDQSVDHTLDAGRTAWLHVARGILKLNDEPLGPGDGAAIREESHLMMYGVEETEFVLFDLP